MMRSIFAILSLCCCVDQIWLGEETLQLQSHSHQESHLGCYHCYTTTECSAVNVHSIRSQWIKIKFYWFHLSQCNAKIQIWNNVSSGHNTYILYLMTTSTWTLKLISDPIRDSFKHQRAALVLDTHFRTVSIVGARFSWSIYVNKMSNFFHNIQSKSPTLSRAV